MAEKNLATVDLRQIVKNAETVRKKAGSALYAVVKADAYGHGAAAVANALHGVADGFVVALLQEGLELRYAGVTKPILLLAPPLSEREAQTAILHDIALSVDGMRSANYISAAATALSRTAEVQIVYNTGMNRFGVTEDGLFFLARALKGEAFRVSGFYSHFADPEDENFTEQQFSRFLRAKREITRIFPEVKFHVAATGALRYGKKYAEDAVRVGLGLYGYGVEGVSPALSVTAPVFFHGRAVKGERLGYGGARNFEGAFSLARFGYADGVPRRSGAVVPHCMDAAYVSGEKDMVEILGKTRPADLVAREWGTIPYEVLCMVTGRCEFRYLF